MAPDKTVIQCVAPDDFTDEKFGWLPKQISVQQKWPRPFNADHFFPWAQHLMRSHILSVYATNKSVIGLMVFPHLFSGLTDGVISFWWSDRDPQSRALWNLVEETARKYGCERLSTSVFGEVNNDLIARLYRGKGLHEAEIVYSKFFN